MKKMIRLLYVVLILTVFSACKKEPAFDPEKQAAADELSIKAFIAANDIPALRHPSGVYYQIITPGVGHIAYTTSTTVSVKYTARLLNGHIFEQKTTPISFRLGGEIRGLKIGVPLIQKGGKIRIFIPSGYAYGPNATGPIPANSVLDYDIELVDVTN